jgi:lipoate-protein ligase A
MDRRWRLIDSGYGDAYSNMALDEALLLAGSKTGSPPVLRFYGFRPAAVSIGYAQDLTDGVKVSVCRQRGVPIVRRPTGGRAVFHDKELTYSLIAPKDYFPRPGILGSYRAIAGGLIQGLRNLGIKADLANPRTKQVRGRNRSAACFLASSWYEIVVGGKKLIGSAQRRVGSHLLQQGSILLAVDYETIADLFPDGGRPRSELVHQARARITSLEELLGRPVNIEEIKQGIKQGMMQALNIEFVEGNPTDHEQSLAHRLYKQKYGTNGWNLEVEP